VAEVAALLVMCRSRRFDLGGGVAGGPLGDDRGRWSAGADGLAEHVPVAGEPVTVFLTIDLQALHAPSVEKWNEETSASPPARTATKPPLWTWVPAGQTAVAVWWEAELLVDWPRARVRPGIGLAHTAVIVDIPPRLNPAVQPRKGDIRAIAIAAEQWDGDEWVPLPTDDDTERTVAWSRTAAEAVRAANHAAHHAPTGDPWNVYSRCGELRELLAHTEQLVEVLADQAGRINGTPRPVRRRRP
jgi:hypothetical protein